MIPLNRGRVRRLEWVRPECDSGHCVEVTTEHGFVLVRSSNMPLELIRFTPEEWQTFLEAAKRDAFDLFDVAEPH